MRTQLTAEQAEAMLPEGDYVHTFVNAAGILLGADWERESVLKRFRDGTKQPPELAGAIATSMNHGICFWDGDHWVFVETKPTNDTPRTAETVAERK